MSRWSVRRFVSMILPAALLASACATVGPSGSAAPGPPTAAPPTATGPAATPPAASSPSLAALPSAAEPPAASLAVEGGDPVTGQLGSFTWGDGGSDSPWLPGSPISIGSGERLTVSVADAVGVATWSAKRVPAGTTDGQGAVGLGAGGLPISFDPPGPGSWSVQVTVDFDAGLGSASYYWLVTVR